MIDKEGLKLRTKALDTARIHTMEIVAAYPPEEYRITTGPTAVLSSPAGSSVMPAETVKNILLDIATWLMGDPD